MAPKAGKRKSPDGTSTGKQAKRMPKVADDRAGLSTDEDDDEQPVAVQRTESKSKPKKRKAQSLLHFTNHQRN